MTISNQRLRNLTTGYLHTKMSDIYEDMGAILGEPDITTIGIAIMAVPVQGWLRTQIADPRFWEDKHDKTHTGETEIRAMTKDEKAQAMKEASL